MQSIQEQSDQGIEVTPSSSSGEHITSSSSSSAYVPASQVGAIAQAIHRLKQLEINFLALDFDKTILSIHTGGRWSGSFEELLPYVRKVFVDLIVACQAAGIEVAVVTFSRQIKLVRSVLDHITDHNSGRIPIRGNDGSWSVNKGTTSRYGKQSHMASAVEELEYRFRDVHITRASTLLIDDDVQNVKTSLQHGTRAIWFNPDKPHRLLQEMIAMK